jgi:hypothetical protein
VLTSWNIIHPHIFFSRPLRRFAGTKFAGTLPLPLDLWNHRVRVEFLCKIRAAKKLDTKIFETNNLMAVIWFFVDCHCLSHDYASCGVGTRLDVTGVGCGKRGWRLALDVPVVPPTINSWKDL